MDRNAIIGLVLIVTIIFSFNMINSDDKKSESTPKKEQTSVPKTDTSTPKSKIAAVAASEQKSKDSSFSVVKNNITYLFSTQGGKLKSVTLNEFKTYSKKPLILFFDQHSEYTFNDKGTVINSSSLVFTPTLADDQITFTANTQHGTVVQHVYSQFKKDGSNKFEVLVQGNESKTLNWNWMMTIPPQEKDLQEERFKSTIHYATTDEKTDYISERKEDTEEPEGKLLWVAFKQKYFGASMVFPKGIEQTKLTTKNGSDSNSVKTMSMTGTTPLENGRIDMIMHFGPSKYYDLKKVGYGLENQVYLGWNLLSLVNQYLILPIFTLVNKTGWGFGIIILIMSLIIKSILFPLTYKSTLSTVKMRLLKPEIDAIKEKMGDDNVKVQAETMKLYSKAGVNPLGGCLPLLLQMPLLFAMFYFFPSIFELRGESFLWAEDLSTYDSLIHWNTSIPVIGTHLSLFTILMTISTLIYTKIQNEVSGATGQMKYIGYIMPIIFLGVLNSYASGLTYYYLLLNLITFAQQAILKRTIDENKLHAQLAENKQKGGGKKSKFQQRLEEMQAAQNRKK